MYNHVSRSDSATDHIRSLLAKPSIFQVQLYSTGNRQYQSSALLSARNCSADKSRKRTVNGEAHDSCICTEPFVQFVASGKNVVVIPHVLSAPAAV